MERMKLIFLDVDGVLNYSGCKARSATGCLGIEDEKVKLLRQIIDATRATVILKSTWKTDWFLSEFIEDLPMDGQYLEKQIAKHNVFIRGKTEDPYWEQGGHGILDFIETSTYNVEQFVILDDESFDFIELGLENRFVKTSFTDGLLPEHVERAVSILNGCKS